MNFLSQTSPELSTNPATKDRNKSISTMCKSKKALVSSQKRDVCKGDPVQETCCDCDTSKMNSISAKITKRSNHKQAKTKRKPSDSVVMKSKETVSTKRVDINTSSKDGEPSPQSSKEDKEEYILGETKHKTSNPLKPKAARPTLSKRLPKIKVRKNHSASLDGNDKDIYDSRGNGDIETAKKDGKEKEKINVGTRCRNVEPRSSKKTCRVKRSKQAS